MRVASAVAVLLALSTLATACAEDASRSDGDVFVTGSSTVEPISVAVAEELEDAGAEVLVDIEGPGTGDGFEKFCDGEADISDASRAIKEEEAAACADAGIEFLELKVAFDGISVVTSPANEVDCLSFDDLYALIGPEAEGLDDWSEAEGATSELPDQQLEITAPGEESGTFDSFVEIVFGDRAETTRPDYSSQADDNAILQGIEGTEGSLGWVGFAFAQEAGTKIKQLEVDGGEGCVAPTAQTIADGSYPIARPLYIYDNAGALARKPGVEAYVDFYLADGIAQVEEVGYVALPPDQLAETRRVWEQRETGIRTA